MARISRRKALAFACAMIAALGASSARAGPAPIPGETIAPVPVDQAEIERLVALMGDESFAVRDAATKRLAAMGKGIYPALRRIKTADPEVAARIAALLDKAAPLWDGKETIEQYARRTGIGKVVRRVALGAAGVPLDLTLVPAGKFMQGTREVTVPQPFYLGVTHVTVDQFAAFVAASGYQTDAENKGSALVLALIGGRYVATATPGASWRNPGFPQKGDHPAVQITWNDARAFCEWLSGATGRIACLPTEVQWEYACRAGSKHQYIWGADSGKDFANVSDISLREETGAAGAGWEYYDWDDKFSYTSPGKSFKPNAFGLYDMIGNAWQWCDPAPQPNVAPPAHVPPNIPPILPANLPANARALPADPARGASRPLRGASWNSRPTTCSMTTRNQHPTDYAYGVGGFRVQMVLDETD